MNDRLRPASLSKFPTALCNPRSPLDVTPPTPPLRRGGKWLLSVRPGFSFPRSASRLFLMLVAVLWICSIVMAQDAPPRSLDARLKIELFAEHPQIVTPTGIDVDDKGRVWAIESNTHFPP